MTPVEYLVLGFTGFIMTPVVLIAAGYVAGKLGLIDLDDDATGDGDTDA